MFHSCRHRRNRDKLDDSKQGVGKEEMSRPVESDAEVEAHVDDISDHKEGGVQLL